MIGFRRTAASLADGGVDRPDELRHPPRRKVPVRYGRNRNGQIVKAGNIVSLPTPLGISKLADNFVPPLFGESPGVRAYR